MQANAVYNSKVQSYVSLKNLFFLTFRLKQVF